MGSTEWAQVYIVRYARCSLMISYRSYQRHYMIGHWFTLILILLWLAGHYHIGVAATPLLYNALYTATKMVHICIVCYALMYEILYITGHDNDVTT